MSDVAPGARDGRVRQVAGSGGLSLHVQERGPAGATTILLVHGYPDDHAVWDLVAAPLAGAHRVVTYDLRGAGGSDAPTTRTGYRMDRLVEDLAAVVDAISPGRPVHLVAHDWGSIQAWSAVTDPTLHGRFASFTSISGPGLDHVSRWFRAHLVPGRGRWTAVRRQGLRSWYILAFQSRFAARFLSRFSGLLPAVIARSEGVATDARWPGPHHVRNAVNGLGLYQANLRHGTRSEVLPATQIPVQLLVPQQDPYVTPALLDGIEAMAPNLVRRDLGGKHWLIRSEPDLVAGLVAAHVAAVEAGRDPEPTAPALDHPTPSTPSTPE